MLPIASIQALTNRLNFELKPLAFLKVADDLEQVASLRIPVGAEHAHQALGRLLRQAAELLKSDRGVDVVTQNRLAGVHIPRQQALDPLLEQFLTEVRIALDTRLETVSAFFQDMRGRGLGDPLLVVSDGAAGIIKAIETWFPRSARQRCLAHRMRNLAAKVPEDLRPEFKARVTAAYQAPSRAIARDLASGVVADYQAELPSASACFMDDFEACIAHLRMPITHRRAIRTTNLLERLFVEERRRLKIIPNAFGEKPVLKLMFGAMIRAAERWRAIRVSELERRQMRAVREELDHEYEAANGLGTRASAPARQAKISYASGEDRTSCGLHSP